MTAAKDFRRFFDDDLSALLPEIELRRKGLLRLFWYGILAAVATIISFFAASSSGSQALSLLAVLLLAATIVFFWVYHKRLGKYVGHFKETIIRQVIAFTDPSLRYQPAEKISRVDYEKSGLFLVKADRYQGDDYVEGMRDKTFFCFSELKTEQRVSSGKNTHYVTIFRGLFFIADFHKHFSGKTFVWSERNPQLNVFHKLFSSFARKLEKVQLESSEFERRFIVYSEDQVEARYILTPSLMERMLQLQELTGDRTTFSFVGTNIYVAVPLRDNLFEPTFFRPNDYTSVGDYYNTLHLVFEIIDTLHLNERIWSKQ